MNASSTARWIQVLVFTTLFGGLSQGLPQLGDVSADGSAVSISVTPLHEQQTAGCAGVLRVRANHVSGTPAPGRRCVGLL